MRSSPLDTAPLDVWMVCRRHGRLRISLEVVGAVAIALVIENLVLLSTGLVVGATVGRHEPGHHDTGDGARPTAIFTQVWVRQPPGVLWPIRRRGRDRGYAPRRTQTRRRARR